MTKYFLVVIMGMTIVSSGIVASAARAEQIKFDRIEQMPNAPHPFKILDWKQIAHDYNQFVFDQNAQGEHLPLLWWDDSRRNLDGVGFGLPSYVGMKLPEKTHHEAVTCIAAVLGATLAGIDKSTGPHNWVQMCETYFHPREGEEVIIDRPTGRSGGSFWYDTFSAILFYGLVDRYPNVGRLEWIMRRNADRWYEACVALGAREGKLSFDYTGFRFSDMTPYHNGKRTEPEGAAGVAWIEYMAYAKFRDPKHLEAARWCMDWIAKYPANPYYEVVLTHGVTLAARMNAEQRTNYDVKKFMDWCLGPSTARPGWGVITERWGEYDVHGLSGSITDGGGYAFAMNTFMTTGAILPTARYDDRYARAIGKWSLNAINNARLFYPREMPEELQSCADWKGDPKGVICYEGLRKTGLAYQQHIQRRTVPESKGKLPPEVEAKWKPITPYASGDPVPFGWEYKTDFALYGAGHVGIFAAIVGKTDDQRILRLNLLPTDYFHEKAYPSSLIYNPYEQAKRVKIDVGAAAVDVYDTVEKKFLLEGVSGQVSIELPADSARVIVLAPTGGKRETQGQKLMVNGVVVDHRVR